MGKHLCILSKSYYCLNKIIKTKKKNEFDCVQINKAYMMKDIRHKVNRQFDRMEEYTHNF